MRMPWSKPKAEQLELLDAEPDAPHYDGQRPVQHESSGRSTRSSTRASASNDGRPLVVPLDRVYEDPSNPRTEFPETELDELAEDIRRNGILQPIVVHPVDAAGLYRIHFGAKRLRAAARAGLQAVPVVVLDAPADPYTQVAENQKRHGLTPLDLARFIKSRGDAGESNAMVAKRLGMNLTTVAHHLALLDLPPDLDEALKSGRCTSPRTLHELARLHADSPAKVQAILASGAEITRTTVLALRGSSEDGAASVATPSPSNRLITQANAACDRLERALGRIRPSNSYKVALPELIALRIRVADITKRWLQGSDRQTPSQAER
jgi:ParB family transcriptional regulator, chromosome partitioning protein